ncbi:uncharacterized protein LOC133859730 [Alnus glutinosa]|uniref:uncharacterized protein LOC133859730 n=1 Tax=Alnus glutinosa TaxID=3517 RepID=UPI002D766F03|nr:uncharacterized protein LOC133859730 [Alnus glutinosa]
MYWFRIDVCRHLVVGLGLQWTSSSDSVVTLQLFIGNLCLVFQLPHAPRVPLYPRRFLSDSDHTFIGVWTHNDQDMLRRPKLLSTKTLSEDLLSFKDVTKLAWVRRSDCEAYWLEEEQVQHAAVDAYFSFRMGKALHVWNWPIGGEATRSGVSSDSRRGSPGSVRRVNLCTLTLQLSLLLGPPTAF